MSDSTKSIFQSATRFFSGTMISRLTGMARDIAMAAAFGTQGSVAAFMVAFRFSHLLRRLLGEGALQTAFVPLFEGLRKESPYRAYGFFRSLMVALTLLLVFIVVTASAGLLLYLGFADPSEGNREIALLTLVMMPSLIFICLYGVNAALLQCEKSYFTPSVAPVAFNIVWIAGVLCLWNTPAVEAMLWLGVVIIVACAAQWAATIPKTLQLLRQHRFDPLWKELGCSGDDLKKLFVPLSLSIMGIASSQINNTLDAVFARYADVSGPAYLWYAIRIQQLPLSLIGVALSGALLPPLARAFHAGELTRYAHFLQTAVQRCALLLIPFSAAFFITGDSCVNLLYGRGDFTDGSTMATTYCLWAYAIGLVPMGLILTMAPAFYARDDYRTPTIASALAVGMNIGLNGILIFGLGKGAASVALATSVSSWFNLLFLSVALERKQKGVWRESALWSKLRMTMAMTGVAVAGVVVVDMAFFGENNLLLMVRGGEAVLPHSFGAQLFRLCVEATAFACPILVLWYRALGLHSSLRDIAPT